MGIASDIGHSMPAISLQALGRLAWIGAIVATIYGAATVIQRLYFHPLAKIPGPFFARATYGYEFYQDVILGGNYVKEYTNIHAKYGACTN